MKILWVLSLVLFWMRPETIWAQSPMENQLRNYDLQSQIEKQKKGDDERVLPQTEKFSLASDLVLWKYWGDTNSYYHGPGFWLDTYGEYRPLPGLTVNGKFSFVNGSSSYGYNQASRLKPFLGATWDPELEDSNWSLLVRFFDLDRNTLGSGLFFQDREMSGLLLGLGYNDFQLNIRLPGTSVLSLAGDLYSMESFWKTRFGEIGIHSFYIVGFGRLQSVGEDESLDLVEHDINAVTSLFWRSNGDGFYQNFEVANNHDQWAGVLGVGYKKVSKCKVCIDSYIQGRYYDVDIVGPLGGSAAFDYIPYNIRFRDYNNAINILGRRGMAQAASANLNVRYNFSPRFFVESLNEVGRIRYNGDALSEDSFYWYRQSFGFCPYKDRPLTCARLFVANKILQTSGIERNFFQPTQVFRRADVFGLEAQIFL